MTAKGSMAYVSLVLLIELLVRGYISDESIPWGSTTTLAAFTPAFKNPRRDHSDGVTIVTELLNEGNAEEADRLAAAMAPLFACVGVTTQEETPSGSVECKARNPLAVKSLMNVLGMPSGPTRRPLGKGRREAHGKKGGHCHQRPNPRSLRTC